MLSIVCKENTAYKEDTVLCQEKSSNEIIFKNSFGVIYENKITIIYKRDNLELLINDLANFRIIKMSDTRINIMMFVLSFFFAATSFFVFVDFILDLICLMVSFILLIMTMFYKKNNYSVQFVLSIARQIVINIDKKDIKSASNFIKKLESYRESNPSLLLLI